MEVMGCDLVGGISELYDGFEGLFFVVLGFFLAVLEDVHKLFEIDLFLIDGEKLLDFLKYCIDLFLFPVVETIH